MAIVRSYPSICLRQEGNIKIDLKELWWDGVALIHLVQDKGWWQALVSTVLNLQVPQRQVMSQVPKQLSPSQ
jgi:hypothetical protein